MTVVLIILVLISINALYVAAEFSTVSARRSRIRQLAQEGNRNAIWLLPVVEDARRLDRYVAACQIGITLSSLILGAYGQATLPGIISPMLGDLGGLQDEAAQATSATVILVGLTSLQVVFGELLPKSLSLQYTTQVSLLCAIPMAISLRIFSGFIYVLNGSGLAILRLLGSGEATHRHIHSPEEIALLLVESRDGGLLEPDEQARLLRALTLGGQPIRGLMVPRTRVDSLDAGLSMEAIVEQTLATPHTRYPVFKDRPDNIIGILHAKDLVRQRLENGSLQGLESLLRPPVFVPESIAADRALTLLREEHSHIAIVIDEYGGFEGIVTLEDLLADVLTIETAREVFAETLPDGRIRIPGSMRLELAAAWLAVASDTDAETVAGFVIEHLGHLPEAGEHLVLDGTRITVETTSRHAIGSLLLEPPKLGGQA